MPYRFSTLAAVTLLVGCTPREQPAPPAPAATPDAPPSAAAIAAKNVAQDYFDKLKARRWRDAHALWFPDAAGPLAGFTNAMATAASFDGTAGKPTAIRSTDGIDYILVEAATATVSAGPRRPAVRRDGVVMLKRPAGGQQPWRIWGTDIRVRHCKTGQQPRGLGCVPA